MGEPEIIENIEDNRRPILAHDWDADSDLDLVVEHTEPDGVVISFYENRDGKGGYHLLGEARLGSLGYL